MGAGRLLETRAAGYEYLLVIFRAVVHIVGEDGVGGALYQYALPVRVFCVD